MSTHSVSSSTSIGHRAFVFAVAFTVLFLWSLSPLRSGTILRVSNTLSKSPVQLFHRTSGRSSLSPRLHRSSAGRGAPATARGAGAGYWHTEGARILTNRQTPVRISGLNWSGFETTAAVPGGLRSRDYHAILNTVAASGFNTIRLPYSNQMVEQPTIPTDIAFENEQGKINTDLEGLDSMQILDHIVSAAGEVGLKVILDNHRSEAGSSAEESGLWYTDQYPEQAWITDWVTLAEHFRKNPTVIGFDLRNEPHNAATTGSCWDCGGERDWHLAAERAGNAILAENGDLLIFVEGVDQFQDTNSFWGGDLAGVRQAPVHLSRPGRLVYSAHVYGPSEFHQAWFNAETTPATLMAKWRRNWSFISESGAAPVWIGEFGAPKDLDAAESAEPGSEGQWFHTLVNYLAQHDEVGWTYWSLNGEDRYGLLDGDYRLGATTQAATELARIKMPMKPASHVMVPSLVAHDALGVSWRTAEESKLQLVKLPTIKLPFHLLPKAAATNNGPEIVVAYDEPKAADLPVMTSQPEFVYVSRPTAEQETVLPAARTEGVNGGHASQHRPAASSAHGSATVSGAIAEQIRRDTEEAIQHLPATKP